MTDNPENNFVFTRKDIETQNANRERQLRDLENQR